MQIRQAPQEENKTEATITRAIQPGPGMKAITLDRHPVGPVVCRWINGLVLSDKDRQKIEAMLSRYRNK